MAIWFITPKAPPSYPRSSNLPSCPLVILYYVSRENHAVATPRLPACFPSHTQLYLLSFFTFLAKQTNKPTFVTRFRCSLLTRSLPQGPSINTLTAVTMIISRIVEARRGQRSKPWRKIRSESEEKEKKKENKGFFRAWVKGGRFVYRIKTFPLSTLFRCIDR